MSNSLLGQIQSEGVSTWLDGVSRGQLESGELQGLVTQLGISGLTTNPTLFAKSLTDTSAYEMALDDLAQRQVEAAEAARLLTAEDARHACDVFLPVYRRTGGSDGRVSLEVNPEHAHNYRATLADVRAIQWLVDRPNLLIKIPATPDGVTAIATATSLGHSINATLIFSIAQYRQVLAAYTDGLARARRRGLDLTRIHSVASVFVSRVDVALAASMPAAADAPSHAKADSLAPLALSGVANARAAHSIFEDVMAGPAWRSLLAAGANPQRLLWASTGAKGAGMDPLSYLVGLVIPGTVNTMPLQTARTAAAAARRLLPDPSDPSMRSDLALARQRLRRADHDVPAQLLTDGVSQFQRSWASVLELLSDRLQRPE